MEVASWVTLGSCLLIANEGSLLILVQYDFRYHVFIKWFPTLTRGEYFPLSSLELILMYAFVKQRTDGRRAEKVNYLDS